MKHIKTSRWKGPRARFTSSGNSRDIKYLYMPAAAHCRLAPWCQVLLCFFRQQSRGITFWQVWDHRWLRPFYGTGRVSWIGEGGWCRRSKIMLCDKQETKHQNLYVKWLKDLEIQRVIISFRHSRSLPMGAVAESSYYYNPTRTEHLKVC